MPRPNLYQSLHTTLMARRRPSVRGADPHRRDAPRRRRRHRRALEVQGHRQRHQRKDEQRLAWVRQLMEWQREMSDPNEFLSTLKIDLYPEEVYTFTPKGKVVVLPKDASPDRLRLRHPHRGRPRHAPARKVNGRIVPLRTRLRNGDIVEIITQTGHTPSRDWLTFAKSSRARNKIKHWLNEHQRERAIEIGSKLLDREARKYKVALAKLQRRRLRPRRQRVRPRRREGSARRHRLRQILRAPGAEQAGARHCIAPSRAGTRSSRSATRSHMSDAVKRVFFGNRAPTRCRSKGRTICSSIARDVAIRFAAKRSSATSRAAKASPSTRADVPTCRTCSTRPTAASRSSGRRTRGDERGRAADLPRQADRLLRRPRRPAEELDRHHLRRRHQHPQRRLARRQGWRGDRGIYCRGGGRLPSGSNCHRFAHTSRRAGCGTRQQGMIVLFAHGQHSAVASDACLHAGDGRSSIKDPSNIVKPYKRF